MKKQSLPILFCLAFVLFASGFLLGRSSGHRELTLNVPESMYTPSPQATLSFEADEEPASSDPFPININTATVQQLMELPGIGQTYAQRIVDYREKNGAFSSVEELLYVKGIGEKRLEAILDLITIGGNP